MAHEHTVMCEKLLVLQHMALEDQAQSAGGRIGEHFKLGLHVPDRRLRSKMACIIFAALSARNMHGVVLQSTDILLMLSKHLNSGWRYLMIGLETALHIPMCADHTLPPLGHRSQIIVPDSATPFK